MMSIKNNSKRYKILEAGFPFHHRRLQPSTTLELVINIICTISRVFQH